MNHWLLILGVLLLFHTHGTNVLAGTQKIQLTEFTVTGTENANELKGILKSLLASRLATDEIRVVDEADGAVARIIGGYTSIGKTFSIDATVKNGAGETLGQRYVQGESQNELIAAIGRLAEQLRTLLLTKQAIPVTAAAVAPEAASQPAGDIVHVAPASHQITQQTRIEGTLIGIAPGRKRSGNIREYVVADFRTVYLYQQADSLKKIAEYPLKREGKILSVDTADVDGDGNPEVYVTVVDREDLVSLALNVSDQGFTPIADKLPFFFRAVAFNGQNRKLVAQNAGRGTDDFYGDMRLVVKKGNVYSLGEPVKLPKRGQIFSFSTFTDVGGKQHTVYIDGDGQLRIADEAGKELWKGNDRFGGSEVYFLRDEQQMQNSAMDRYRWRFLEQRVVITPDGDIIIPKNSGLLSVGNNRAYSKSVVTGYVWNGANLEERWHTKESPNYLADFFYDAERKELVLLEHAQKEGVFSKGTSVIVTRKTETAPLPDQHQ